MEVKILCPCGAKYKFDVEPLNGKLPGPVQCPVCNADGTASGNEIIARLLSSVPPPPAAPVVRIPAPPQSPAHAVQPARSGFVTPVVPRSSKDLAASAPPVPAQHPAPAIGTPSVAAIPTATPPPPSGGPMRVTPQSVSGQKLSVSAVHTPAAASEIAAPAAPPVGVRPSRSVSEVSDPSFARGLVGIGAASFVGLLLWFAITLFLGPKFKWGAIAIGALIGWTGLWLGKQKSQKLGFSAAIATALVMIFGMVWSVRHEAYTEVNEMMDNLWQGQLAYAKEAVKASSSDAQLSAFLEKNGFGAEESDEDSENDSPVMRVGATGSSSIDAKAVSEFRRTELPKLRQIADGKMSKGQFEREYRAGLEELVTLGFIFSSAFSIKTIIVIGLAIGAAWKFTAE